MIASTDLQATFEKMIPQIRGQAEHAFRGKNPELKEELIAEVVANSYCAYVRLAERDKLDVVYPTVLARYAIRHAKVGRRVGTPMNGCDVTSEYAQRKHLFDVERLDHYDEAGECWREVVVEDKTTTPAELAAFRIDFPEWLETLNDRLRNLVAELVQGEPQKDVARRFGVTSGRVSQMRRELKESWMEFCGEEVGVAVG